jgi:phage shock protein A
VRGRVFVSCFERVRERFDRREERALEAGEAGRVRDRELGLVCKTAEQLEVAVSVLAVG